MARLGDACRLQALSPPLSLASPRCCFASLSAPALDLSVPCASFPLPPVNDVRSRTEGANSARRTLGGDMTLSLHPS